MISRSLKVFMVVKVRIIGAVGLFCLLMIDYQTARLFFGLYGNFWIS